MRKGESNLKKYISNRGYYGEIEISVELTTSMDLELSFADDSFKEWETGIRFGSEYFFQHYIKSRKGGIKLKITNVRGEIVDTTQLLISYILIKALNNALDMDSYCIFDELSGDFLFKH